MAGAIATRFNASASGPVYGPTYAAAADASAGGVLAADVVFAADTVAAGLQLVFDDNRTATCPVGWSPTSPNITE